MTQAKASYKPLVFETADEVWGAYEAERCDAITTDKSGLISRTQSGRCDNPDEDNAERSHAATLPRRR